MADGIIGKGFKLEFNLTNAFTGTQTAVVGLKKVGAPKKKVAKVDLTDNDSANSTKTNAPGWIEYETMSIEGNFIKATAVALDALGAVTQYWKYSLSDGSYYTFQGFLSGWEPAASDTFTGAVEAKGEITLINGWTLT